MSGEDCRDLTKTNNLWKRECCYKSLPNVKLCRRRPKERCGSLPKKVFEATVLEVQVVGKVSAVVSRRKERARGVCEDGLPKIKIEQKREGSCGRAGEEVRGRVKRE